MSEDAFSADVLTMEAARSCAALAAAEARKIINPNLRAALARAIVTVFQQMADASRVHRADDAPEGIDMRSPMTPEQLRKTLNQLTEGWKSLAPEARQTYERRNRSYYEAAVIYVNDDGEVSFEVHPPAEWTL